MQQISNQISRIWKKKKLNKTETHRARIRPTPKFCANDNKDTHKPRIK